MRSRFRRARPKYARKVQELACALSGPRAPRARRASSAGQHFLQRRLCMRLVGVLLLCCCNLRRLLLLTASGAVRVLISYLLLHQWRPLVQTLRPALRMVCRVCACDERSRSSQWLLPITVCLVMCV